MFFISGLIVSGALSLILSVGMSVAYGSLFTSSAVLIVLITLCSLLLWLQIRVDHMFDLDEVFCQTISFDFSVRQPAYVRALKFLRPVNPYMSVLAAMLVLLLVFCVLPALMMHLLVSAGRVVMVQNILVFFMGAGAGLGYLAASRAEFSSAAGRFMFIAGTLLGPAGVLKILS